MKPRKIGYAKEDHYKPSKNVTMDESILKAINDYQYEFRCKNFSEATEELIRLGLRVLEKRREKQHQLA